MLKRGLFGTRRRGWLRGKKAELDEMTWDVADDWRRIAIAQALFDISPSTPLYRSAHAAGGSQLDSVAQPLAADTSPKQHM